MKTKIYGASDDLIEIDGIINDEIGCYDHKRPIKITCSDGTTGSIFYDGEWKINVKFAGSAYLQKVDSVGDDGEHTGEATGCTSYSDVLIFDKPLDWIQIGRKTLRATLNS